MIRNPRSKAMAHPRGFSEVRFDVAGVHFHQQMPTKDAERVVRSLKQMIGRVRRPAEPQHGEEAR